VFGVAAFAARRGRFCRSTSCCLAGETARPGASGVGRQRGASVARAHRQPAAGQGTGTGCGTNWNRPERLVFAEQGSHGTTRLERHLSGRRPRTARFRATALLLCARMPSVRAFGCCRGCSTRYRLSSASYACGSGSSATAEWWCESATPGPLACVCCVAAVLSCCVGDVSCW